MDAKQAKSLLKNAREAIRNKDFKEALKHCKAVLKHDKSNYSALVFVGVAAEGLEQPDQALMAYKRATDIASDQILAWQGLCGFYEKSEVAEHRADLVNVYKRLLDFQASDVEKSFETSMKLGKLQEQLGDFSGAVETYTALAEKCDGDNKCQVWKEICQLLEKQKSLPDDLVTVDCYGNVVHNKTDFITVEERESMWIKYIKLLKKSGSEEAVVRECEGMSQEFDSCPFPLQVLSKIYLDSTLTSEECKREEVNGKLENICKALLRLLPDCVEISLLQGYQNILKKDWIQARKMLQQGIAKAPNNMAGRVYLAQAQVSLHDNHAALETISRVLPSLQGLPALTGVVLMLQGYRLQAMLDMKTGTNLAKAHKLALEFVEESGESAGALVYLGYVLLAMDNREDAKEVVQKAVERSRTADTLALRGWLYWCSQEYSQAEQCTKEALSLQDSSAKLHHQMARVLWAQLKAGESGKKEACFTSFLKAAKLDPYHSDTFLYLGHYYADVMKDKIKARRCYQKAYDLDRESGEAGAALVDVLNDLGEEGSVLTLLQGATQRASAGSGKWAWLRLGLHQMKHEGPTAAVNSLQAALRADPKDVHCWECLGEAYMSRGSFTAALKTFMRATELDSSLLYPRYQVATIKMTLGLYSEAVTEYQQLCDMSPDYVPGLKGLGETLLLLARGAIKEFFNGRAVDHCEAAIGHLTRAVSFRPDFSCLWKLLGDACTILHPVHTSDIRMNVPKKLLSKTSGDSKKSGETTCIGKKELLGLGARCYGQALKLQSESDTMWHDIGANYFWQAEEYEAQEAKDLANKALQCLKKSVTLDPQNFRHWISLGVVAASKEVQNLYLAQHCFIKSIEQEANNVTAWTNLGTLYLKNEQKDLANQAFKTAQSLEPSYVASWIGQALIAETIGHEDAMDLFRHATELARHVESGVGYGHWVCRTLQGKKSQDSELYRYSIEQMAAVPAASDVLAAYTSRVKDNPTAYNMHGLLLEKQGLLSQACQAYNSAAQLLQGDPDAERRRQVTINHARALRLSGDFEASVQQYQAAGALTRFEDICGLALASYKAGRIQESYQAYAQAVELSSTEEDRILVCTALGMVAYKYNDLNGAKTALFKCAQGQPGSIYGLLALCSLGLLQKDITLANAVLQELDKLGDVPDHIEQCTLLRCAIHTLQGNYKDARNEILRAVHRAPDKQELWSLLARQLHRYQPSQSRATCQTAKVAHRGRNKNDKVVGNLLSSASTANGLHSRKDSSNNAIKLAQRALHNHPDSLEGWCCLLSALYAEYMVRRVALSRDTEPLTSLLTAFCTTLMAKFESKLSTLPPEGSREYAYIQGQYLWCVKQYAVCLLQTGRQSQASQLLQQAGQVYAKQDVLCPSLLQLSAFAQGDLKSLATALIQGRMDSHHASLTWQLLAEIYLCQGVLREVETVFTQCLQSATSSQLKLTALLHLAHLAYSKILASSDDSKERWTKLFQETVTCTQHIQPECAVVQLMLGVIALQDKNTRLAKRCYLLCLSGGDSNGLGEGQRLAAKQLLPIVLAKNDEAALQVMLSSAIESGDTAMVDLLTPHLQDTQDKSK